jgi:hypothetical protein
VKIRGSDDGDPEVKCSHGGDMKIRGSDVGGYED